MTTAHRSMFRFWLVFLAVGLLRASLLEGAPPQVEVSPGQDLQAAIRANPAGTTFLIKAGVHRLSDYVIPKNNDQFIGERVNGERATILNGAQVLTNFARSGSAWVASGMTMENLVLKAACAGGGDICKYPNDVFYDHAVLKRVMSAAEVGPGMFYFDLVGDEIHIGDDPAGHIVEVGVATRAFKGWQTGRTGILIRGLIFEKFANEATIGAINGRHGWTVENCEVRLNHGAGIQAQFMRQNHVHHNGQYGVSYGGDDAIIEGNEIAFNHYAGFGAGYSGGSKFLYGKGLIIRNNYVHHNNGNGLWTDGDNISVLYEGNRVEDNTGAGIFHEIGWDAVIRNNIVRNNNMANDGKSIWWGANIMINASQNVEVYGNTVEGGHGIGIADTGTRGVGGHGPRTARNNYVHDNVITLTLGSRSGMAGVASDADANNRFVNNTYYLADLNGKHFQWSGAITKEGWMGLGQDVNGTFARRPATAGSSLYRSCNEFSRS